MKNKSIGESYGKKSFQVPLLLMDPLIERSTSMGSCSCIPNRVRFLEVVVTAGL